MSLTDIGLTTPTDSFWSTYPISTYPISAYPANDPNRRLCVFNRIPAIIDSASPNRQLYSDTVTQSVDTARLSQRLARAKSQGDLVDIAAMLF